MGGAQPRDAAAEDDDLLAHGRTRSTVLEYLNPRTASFSLSLIRNTNFSYTRKRYFASASLWRNWALGGVATTMSMSLPAKRHDDSRDHAAIRPDRNSGPFSIGVIRSAGRTSAFGLGV